jgi:hypothetical protein
MRTSESTQQLVKALVATRCAPVLRAAVTRVGQNREYKYADLAGILDGTIPPLLAQGLAVLQVVEAENATLITRLAHVSGEWVEATRGTPGHCRACAEVVSNCYPIVTWP